jgi:DNA-binding MarR family transcriptional regulator
MLRMSLDALILNPGRLRILTALAEGSAEFVDLRARTRLTDGNLATHARRLVAAGLVSARKDLREGRPVTQYELTDLGRSTLRTHVRDLSAALAKLDHLSARSFDPAEEWVD